MSRTSILAFLYAVDIKDCIVVSAGSIEATVREFSIRHGHTRYGEILIESGDRQSARAQVRDKISEVLRAWGEDGPMGQGDT